MTSSHRHAVLAVALMIVAAPVFSAQGQPPPKSDADVEREACGPAEVQHDVQIAMSAPQTMAPAGQAIVVVVRPSTTGRTIQTKLAVDGKWEGVNLGQTYFTMTLAPGEHYLCSDSGTRDLLSLRIEAGRTYYVEQRPAGNVFGKMKNTLRLLTEREGQQALKTCLKSTMVVKNP